MALSVERAVAEILRDGDPARSILGLAATEGFVMYDVASPVDVDKQIWVSEEPPDPNQTVTVILEGGAVPVAGSLGQGIGRRPSFTIRTRAPKYEDAYARALAIYEILDEFEGVVHAIPFFRINADTDPIPLGRDREDAGGRWIVTQTYRTITKRYNAT